ncbi:MAG: cytochrome c peroxidase, partial [Thermoanaerobaculia bacterium]|nr:cytochrome c peroxidase [Thermoanaerobaculia bacterium]
EMGQPSLGAVVVRMRGIPEYPPLFEAAFSGPPTVERAGRALAAYMRTLLSGDSAFDRWYFGGDRYAFDEAALAGYRLFVGSAGCVGCHVIGADHALFSDGEFHDTGIGLRRRRRLSEPNVRVHLGADTVAVLPRRQVASVGEPAQPDLGRYEVTGRVADRWRYRTPSLRNVALTAPYMHDGSLATLEDVVRHYDRGGEPHEGQDPRIRPLDLGDEEVEALVAFLHSLTGSNAQELIEDSRAAPVGNPEQKRDPRS